MSCNAIGTISLECLDSIGGLETIYYIQKSKVTAINLDTATNTITGITLSATGNTNKFQEIQVNENSSSWVETNQFNLENGSQGWEIALTIVFSKSDALSRSVINQLVKTKCYVIVKNNDGRYFFIGYRNGGYFNGGDYGSGKALSDRNGYQLVFTSFEAATAYEVSSTIISALILEATV